MKHKDKYYKHCLYYYDMFSQADKNIFDEHRNDSDEDWAQFVARKIIPFDENAWYEVEELKYKIIEKTNGEYCLALRYCGGSQNKIFVKHKSKKCNYNKFWVTQSNFFNMNSRCPICNESKGENSIRNFLKDNNINFISQYYFKDLKGKKNAPLKFDFAILDDENKILFLIEYDGIYHYEITNNSTKEKLKTQQERDMAKNIYCEKHNIKLLRIPYWEFDNIKTILERIL